MERTVMELVKIAQQKFEDSGIEMARLESEMLAAHVLGCERHELYLNRELKMSSGEVEDFFNMTEERCMGKPIQYIIGHREFMGLDFDLDCRVLIPRCDTEIVVESALDRLSSDREMLVADIGTGSGAIAVSLAYHMPNVKVVAVDIDEEALSIAKKNADKYGVENRIELLEGDLFEPLRGRFHGAFDAIISNPPYIRTDDIATLATQVREYEPKAALDGGEDGLDFYRVITAEAYLFLREGGLVALEVGYDQAEIVSKMLHKRGNYVDISHVRDLSGIERVVVAHRSRGKKE